MNIFKSRSALVIVVSYFTISFLYVILSERVLLYLFQNHSSNALIHEIQYYNALSFVLLTAVILVVILRKRDAINKYYTNSLQSNKLKYNNLFNNLSHGVVYTATDGFVLAINKAGLDLLGVTKKQMLGKSIYSPTWKPIHEDSTPLEPHEHPAKIALNTKKPVRNRTIGILNSKTQKYIWLKINSIPEFKAGNIEPYRVCITVDDITSLKNYQNELEGTQEEIKESLKKVALSEFLLKEGSVMANIGVYEINSEKDSNYFSDEMYRFFNLPVGHEYFLEAIRKAYKKQSKALLAKLVKECMEKGTPFDVELEIEFVEKATVWTRVIGKPIYDKNNKIIGRRGVVQDITDLKNNEEKIKESLRKIALSEFLLKEASEMSKIGVYEFTSKKDSKYFSDGIYRVFNIPLGQESPFEAMEKALKKQSNALLNRLVKECMEKGTPFDVELEIDFVEKPTNWIRVIGKPIYDENNDIIGRRGVIQDITDIKRSQLELEVSNEKLQNSLELAEKKDYSLKQASKMAKIGYWEYNSVTDITIWSDYIHHVFGSDPKEGPPSQKNITKIYDKESKKKQVQANLDLFTKGIPYDIELKLVNLKKQEVWIRNVVQPIYNKKKEIVGRRGVMQNITNSKKAQLELEFSKNKLQNSLEIVEKNEYLLKEAGRMANLGYWEYDKQTDTIRWSEAIHQIYGTDSKKGTPEIDVILSIYDEKSRKKIVEATVDLATNGVPYDLELHLINLRDEKRWIRNIGEPIYNEQNEIIGRRGVSQDITHQKLIESNLKRGEFKIKKALIKVERSEFLLNESERIAKIGAWDLDLASQKIRWSNQVFELCAMPVGEVPSLDEIINFYIEGSDEILKNAIEECITDKKKYDLELRFENVHNEKLWVNAIGNPVINGQGQVIGLRGTLQDITQQKLSRDEIEEAEKMYRLLADNTNDLICLHEPDSTFKYISPSIKALLGYEPLEFLGKKAISLVHKDDILSLKNALKKKSFNGVVMDAFPFRARHKKGHFVWLEFLVSPIYINKKISYYVSSTRDVTQWVLAKQEIQKYQTSLQKLTTKITLVEEKQKKEIATNIHDHLSQSLVISKMRINELRKKSPLKMIDEDLQFIEAHISEALENSRKITYELSPPVLYQLGIIDALSWLLDNIEATHKIECRFKSNVTNIKLDDVKSILLFRSIQEVITNAIKYANASLITLNLDKNKLGVYILITDNGVGFDTSVLSNNNNHSGSGFGLFTVQERIQNIQGKFTIASEVNVGTIVKINLPLTK